MELAYAVGRYLKGAANLVEHWSATKQPKKIAATPLWALAFQRFPKRPVVPGPSQTRG